MRNLILAGAAAITVCCATATFAAQTAEQMQPPVIQTQANPPGPGMPSETPPNPSTANSPVPPAMPADTNYNAGPYKGALTPPPQEAKNRTYPVCTSALQDSCVNRGESGVGSEVATPTHRRARHAYHST